MPGEGQSIPKLANLTPDNRVWRLDWFGNCEYPAHIRRYSQPSVKVVLSPLRADLSDQAAFLEPTSTDHQHHWEAWAPISALPLLGIGDLWQDGRQLTSPDYQAETFKSLTVILETTSFVKGGLAIDEHFLLPLSQHPWHRTHTHAYCVAVELGLYPLPSLYTKSNFHPAKPSFVTYQAANSFKPKPAFLLFKLNLLSHLHFFYFLFVALSYPLSYTKKQAPRSDIRPQGKPRLHARNRSLTGNRHLAFVLSAIAGAINAGGFLVVGQFTSHMSGILSLMAENATIGAFGLLMAGVASMFFFIAGAASSAVLINWARKRRLEAEFAMPLIAEAVLLLFFALLGGNIASVEWLFVPVTVMLLCLIMGLQNAMITKLSHAEIRTTHVTGMVTDIGIELGKALYWNSSRHPDMRVRADVAKLKNLSMLVSLFFIGGVVGALCFREFGFSFTLVPLVDDLRRALDNARR